MGKIHKKDISCGVYGYFTLREITEIDRLVTCKNCLKIINKISPEERVVRQRESSRMSKQRKRQRELFIRMRKDEAANKRREELGLE